MKPTDILKDFSFSGLPLELIAFACFTAQLANPEVRSKQADVQVIAKRAFDAALAFREEAARVRKEGVK